MGKKVGRIRTRVGVFFEGAIHIHRFCYDKSTSRGLGLVRIY